MNILNRTYLKIQSLVRVFGSHFLRMIELSMFRAEWQIKNKNNETFPVKYFPINLVTIGDHSYGPIDVYAYYAKGEGLKIGKYCSIAKDVRFILGGNHQTDCLMTYPVINKFSNNLINQSLTKGKIIIEDDVWIGVGAMILSGVRIGQGSVIAAGALVTKSFPPYSIIGGNPAKIIKMRFDETTILSFEESEFNMDLINPEIIKKNMGLFEMKINSENIQAALSQIIK